MSEIQLVRDSLLKKKTLQEQKQDANNQKIKKVKEFIEAFTEERINLLELEGYDIRSALNIDFEKLRVDEEYCSSVKNKLKEIAVPLFKKVKEVADV